MFSVQLKESNASLCHKDKSFRAVQGHGPHWFSIWNNTMKQKKTAVCFLLGNLPASEFYMPTFRKLCLFHLHRQVGMKCDWV